MAKRVSRAVAACTEKPPSLEKKSFRKTSAIPHGRQPGSPCTKIIIHDGVDSTCSYMLNYNSTLERKLHYPTNKTFCHSIFSA